MRCFKVIKSFTLWTNIIHIVETKRQPDRLVINSKYLRALSLSLPKFVQNGKKKNHRILYM